MFFLPTRTGLRKNILQPVVLPYLQGLEQPLFQQGNAQPHTARCSLEFLEESNVSLLSWPFHSTGKITSPFTSLAYFRLRSQKDWQDVPQEIINYLISFMPCRVNECLKNRGFTHFD